jgi:peptide/nickel transport system permease protein
MTRYVFRRIGQAVLVIWATYTITFFLLYALPGDPIALMLHRNGGAGDSGGAVDDEAMQELRSRFGFDQPLIVQYFTLLFKAVRGDLSDSIQYGKPVTDVIAAALPSTLLLTAAALITGLVLGLVVAWASTFARNRWLRSVLQSLPSVGASLPAFWVGLILLQIFSFKLGWFPPLGDDGIATLVLPVLTLAIPTSAYIAQVLASSLSATMGEHYIQTAKAKGASPERVQFRHALRNAILPALTVSGILVGSLLAGTVVVETIFSRSGLGRLTEGAVAYQDIPLVQGVVLVSALAFVTVNLIVDLIYPLIDPRIIHTAKRSA